MRTVVTIVTASTLALTALTGAAWASSLSARSTQLGGGGASVGRCDSDGAGFEYTVSAGPTGGPAYVVDTVVLTGVAAACDGGLLRLTLANAAGASLTSATSTVTLNGATRATVVLTTKPSAADVKAVYAVLQR